MQNLHNLKSKNSVWVHFYFTSFNQYWSNLVICNHLHHIIKSTTLYSDDQEGIYKQEKNKITHCLTLFAGT